VRLTDKAAAELELPAGKDELFAWDDTLPRFGLRVRRAKGGKIHRGWLVQYRADGRQRRLGLGLVGTVTAQEARAAARKALAQADLGADPAGDKAAKRLRSARTLSATVEAYLEERQGDMRPNSWRVTALYLRGIYFRSLHSAALADIKHADVAVRVTAIKRDHGSPTARQARIALSNVFRFGIGEGWIDSNPVLNTNAPKAGEPRDRVLTDAELAAIYRACGDDDFGRIVRLLVLMPARRSEVGGLRWCELDLEKGLWSLPAARSKNHRPHEIPLTPAVQEILQAVPRTGDHLFGRRGSGFTNWESKHALDARCGVANWVLHDLRRTCATRLADIGVLPHAIEAALNHQSGSKRGVAGTCNRSQYAPEVRTALLRWADYVTALVEDRDDREQKVVPLRVS
jgi:integrase